MRFSRGRLIGECRRGRCLVNTVRKENGVRADRPEWGGPFTSPAPPTPERGQIDVGKKRKRTRPDGITPKYLKSHTVGESKEYKRLSYAAQAFFDVMCRLRNRYRSSEEDESFWRSDMQLMRDSGMPRNTMKRARQELVEGGFLHWQSHLGEKHKEARYYVLDDIYEKPDDRGEFWLRGPINYLS